MPPHRKQRQCLASVRLPRRHRIVRHIPVARIAVLASNGKHQSCHRTPAAIPHCRPKKPCEKCRQLQRKRLLRLHRNTARHQMIPNRCDSHPLETCPRPNRSQWTQQRPELDGQRLLYRACRVVIRVRCQASHRIRGRGRETQVHRSRQKIVSFRRPATLCLRRTANCIRRARRTGTNWACGAAVPVAFLPVPLFRT